MMKGPILLRKAGRKQHGPAVPLRVFMVFQLVFAAMPPALINRIEPCVKNRVLCNSQMAKRAHLAKAQTAFSVVLHAGFRFINGP
jgi:hypothetical protein